MNPKEINDVFNILRIQSSTDEEHYDPYEFGEKISQHNLEIRNISYSDRIDERTQNEQLQAVYG